jgi:hypothetical protein
VALLALQLTEKNLATLFFVLFRKQHVRLEPTIEGEQRIRPVVKTKTGALRSGPEAAVTGRFPAEVSQP